MNLDTLTHSLCDAALNQVSVDLWISGKRLRLKRIDRLLFPKCDTCYAIVNGYRSSHKNVDDTLGLHAQDHIEVCELVEKSASGDDGYRYSINPTAVSVIREAYSRDE